MTCCIFFVDCVGSDLVEKASGLGRGILRFIETVLSIFILNSLLWEDQFDSSLPSSVLLSTSIARFTFFCFLLPVVSTGTPTVGIANTLQ